MSEPADKKSLVRCMWLGQNVCYRKEEKSEFVEHVLSNLTHDKCKDYKTKLLEIQSFKHPNIVPLQRLELVDEGTLRIEQDVLCYTIDQVTWDWNFLDSIFVATQIFRGVSALHERDLILETLGDDRILFETDGKTVRINPIPRRDRVTFSMYTAPECLDNKGFSKASDVYSAGMLFYHVLVEKPFLKVPIVERKDAIKEGCRPAIPQPKDVDTRDKSLLEIIQKCWSIDPDERPTAAKVYAELELLADNLLKGNSY